MEDAAEAQLLFIFTPLPFVMFLHKPASILNGGTVHMRGSSTVLEQEEHGGGNETLCNFNLILMGMCVEFSNMVTQFYAERLLTQVAAGLTSFGTAFSSVPSMPGGLRRPHH